MGTCKTLCLAKKPTDYNKLFFGDYGNFQRLDKVTYPIFKKLAEDSEGNTWFMNEIDYTRDVKGIDTLSEVAFRMFHLNILYQNNMDSLVPNTFGMLSTISTDTWLSYLYSRIATEEQIHCISEEEEILTSKGWKKLKDLTLEDEVANWRYKDGCRDGSISFKKPITIQKQHYKGDMVKWSMDNMEYTVTPNHRVVSYAPGRGNVRWKTEKAKKCNLHNYNIPISGFKERGNKHNLSFMDRLAIAFQADGSFMDTVKCKNKAHKTKRGCDYRFGFKSQSKVTRLQWILDNLGCDYTITQPNGKGYTNFYVWVEEKFDKEFSWVNLKEITSLWAKEFIQELKYWDGVNGQAPDSLSYINTNKEAIDKIMGIAVLCGYQVGVDENITERSMDYTNNKSKHKAWCLYLTPKTYKTGRELQKGTVPFDGTIVGVEVASSYIVVRFKGKYIVVTGNSSTYSNGLIQVFGDKAEEMMDVVYDDKVLQKRTDKEIEAANKFMRLLIVENRTDDEAKMALVELLLRTYFLEGVKFPFSFFVTWTINKTFGNAIQGFSQSLKLIAHDELTTHVVTGKHVLKKLLQDTNQGFTHLKKDIKAMAMSMAKETAELEFEWNDYLQKDGSIQGYTKEIGYKFIKYWTDVRLRDIGLEEIYKEGSFDIIDWYNAYRDLNKTQVALQEADNTNYQKGQLKNDLQRFDNRKDKTWKIHTE